MPTVATRQIEQLRDYIHGVDVTLERLHRVLSTLSLPELAVPDPAETGDGNAREVKEPWRRGLAIAHKRAAAYWKRTPVAERKLVGRFAYALRGLPARTRTKLAALREKKGYAVALRAAKREHK